MVDTERGTRARSLLVIALVCALAVGCDQGGGVFEFAPAADMALVGSSERDESAFLAYEHTLIVDTSEDKLLQAFQSVTAACAADRENQCTVLRSQIEYGRADFATIRLRIKPEGVNALTSLAADSGEVVRRSTEVEDLAKTIADIDKRVAMLTATRDRLMELEERGVDDVESLIKIATELTRVQAELEEALGQSTYQRQRVDMDILTIQFVVEVGRSFWSPIGDALSSFGQTLSDGLADTIYAIAYLLPWIVLLLAVGYLVRTMWRRGKRSSKTE